MVATYIYCDCGGNNRVGRDGLDRAGASNLDNP
jgi:hypothetical protein